MGIRVCLDLSLLSPDELDLFSAVRLFRHFDEISHSRFPGHVLQSESRISISRVNQASILRHSRALALKVALASGYRGHSSINGFKESAVGHAFGFARVFREHRTAVQVLLILGMNSSVAQRCN